MKIRMTRVCNLLAMSIKSSKFHIIQIMISLVFIEKLAIYTKLIRVECSGSARINLALVPGEC